MDNGIDLLKQRKRTLEIGIAQLICQFLDENQGVNIDDLKLTVEHERNFKTNEINRVIDVKIKLTI